MKVIGKTLLLTFITCGLTAAILFAMDHYYMGGSGSDKINTDKMSAKSTVLRSDALGKNNGRDAGPQPMASAQAGGTLAGRGQEKTGRDASNVQKSTAEAQTAGGVQKSAAGGQTAGGSQKSGGKAGKTAEKQKEKADKNQEKGAGKNNQQKEDAQKKHTFCRVSKRYFSDAVFIGDSRTVGLMDSGLLPDATYYAKVGIGIQGVLSQRFISEGGTMLTLEEALSRHSFAKVYLMVGINDMSGGDVEWFMEKYREILDIVQHTQPDAIVYIQGNIPMGYYVQDFSGGALNNENLKLRNEASAQLAGKSSIFYLKVEDLYSDANGNLNTYFSADGLHIKPEYYPIWVDYLLHHAAVQE